jgi:hypothetical protein
VSQGKGTTGSLLGVAYGDNTFVAVGDGGSGVTGHAAIILTSPDGKTWTDVSPKTATGLYGVAYADNTFVAVGAGSATAILTSPDGKTWTDVSPGNAGALYGVAYADNTFVAAGIGGLILTSPDGKTWTSRTSGTGNQLLSVAYGADSFVAVGAGGTVLQSVKAATHVLAIAAQGTGSGTVTSDPSGINCGSTCSASFTRRTAVTLSAAPATGSTFAGWSGGGCSGTGTCTVTINSDITVTATFSAIPYTLSATIQGSGTVSGTGLTCSGTSCSGSYPYNTNVTLTATPAGGAGFISWTGCDATSGTACSVAMTSNRSVTATFTTPNPCTYTISSAGKSFTNKGGSVSVAVTATGAKACVKPDITASDPAWMGATLAAYRNNRGSVKVTAKANATISTRTGTATIGGKAFNVTQTGIPCALTAISPTRNILTSSGGSFSFSVTATTGCAWAAEAAPGSATWLDISSASGSGNGSVTYAAAQNTTKRQRNGKITVYLTATPTRSKAFTVTQKK